MSRLLTTKEAATYLGLQPQTLEKWRCTGLVKLKYSHIGKRAIRYRQADLDAFIEAQASND